LRASDTTALAAAAVAYRSGALTVTTLMIWPGRYALTMLADLPQAARPAAAVNAAGSGEAAAIAPGSHGDVVAAERFVYVGRGTSGP
jgi:hypothetical protein